MLAKMPTVFVELAMFNLKFTWNINQCPQPGEFWKKEIADGKDQPYYEASVVKTMCFWSINSQMDQWNRTENPETFRKPILHSDRNSIWLSSLPNQWRKVEFLGKWCCYKLHGHLGKWFWVPALYLRQTPKEPNIYLWKRNCKCFQRKYGRISLWL